MSDMERQGRESDVEPASALPDVHGPDSGQAAHAMLSRGVSDPAAYARYIETHPQQRDAVLTMLNRTLGNSFVAQVARLLGQGQAPSSEAMNGAMTDFHKVDEAPTKTPGQGHAPSAEATSGAMADFREVNGDTQAASSAQVEIEASNELAQPTFDTEELVDSNAAAPKVLGPIRVSARALHVRSSGDSTKKDNIVGMLHRGDVVTAVAIQGSWLQIEYRGKTAFIHGDFVETVGKREELTKTPGAVRDDNNIP